MAILTFEKIQRHIILWRIATIGPLAIAGAVFLIFNLSSTSEEITRDQFDVLLAPSDLRAPNVIHYKGRKGNFDYFVRSQVYSGSEKYHLCISDTPVERSFPYSSDSNDWEQMR